MSRSRRDEGASAVELSIVAPALLLLIFAILQFGLWFYGRNVALQAAREGVSTLRLARFDDPSFNPDAELDRVETAVMRYADQLGQQALLDATADAEYVDGGERVRVRVTGRAVRLVPGLTLRIDRTVTGERERFEPDRPAGP
jgi:Flp pilus assembly protein TadG